MKSRLRLCLISLSSMLCACNMVISETPVFVAADSGGPAPADGLWVRDDDDCSFDSSGPESSWPECAMWAVSRQSGRDLEYRNPKGESQRITAIFVSGKPEIVQAEWIDEAKEPKRSYYVFYAVDPTGFDTGGSFTRAWIWPVQCGTQATYNSDIHPFPGISAECRPSSKNAIRSAADLSRDGEDRKQWRWLRPENR